MIFLPKGFISVPPMNSTRRSRKPKIATEIQFIDGGLIDCELAKGISINQANFAQFFDCVDNWEDHEKTILIIAVGECGYQFDTNTNPDDFDISIYHVDNMRELAEQFVDEGLFGEIPDSLGFYIDHDAIARDLAVDYSEAIIGGERLIYRCG